MSDTAVASEQLRRYVESHHGRLEIDSKADEGTQAARGDPMRVIIGEDEALLREGLPSSCSRAGSTSSRRPPTATRS